ncbi:MAG: hypothetical protein E7638_04730 [Ruminococcaceae bacterium]|nr:hypothetical protein [Oscillospiraceae bacterium]
MRNEIMERQLREQMKICDRPSLSDEAALARLRHYKRRLIRLRVSGSSGDSDYFRNCCVMHEVYRRIAERRGLI